MIGRVDEVRDHWPFLTRETKERRTETTRISIFLFLADHKHDWLATIPDWCPDWLLMTTHNNHLVYYLRLVHGKISPGHCPKLWWQSTRSSCYNERRVGDVVGKNKDKIASVLQFCLYRWWCSLSIGGRWWCSHEMKWNARRKHDDNKKKIIIIIQDIIRLHGWDGRHSVDEYGAIKP